MNPTVKEVFDYINELAPFDTQCEWDNSGFLVGEPLREVRKIAVVLDITVQAVEFAAENGVDLIVSHHPVIFRPVSSVKAGSPVFSLVSNGISAICAHTCLDKSVGGVNDALAAKLGFNAVPLCKNGDKAMLRIAEIEPMNGEALAGYVSEKLGSTVRIADSGKAIGKVALCGGSGSDFIFDAVESGCDAFITGDASHRNFLDALSAGITLIAAGHYETENPVVNVLAESLREKFGIEVLEIPQSSPVKFILRG